MNDRPLLFATRAYSYLETELAAFGQYELGEIVRESFPDGERYRRISTPCGGRDVILLGGTISDADTLELYDLACTLVYYGARRLTLVIPYFGYSTMERAVKTGEVVTAKTRARLLSSIPSAAAGNRVFLVDLHAEGITHYFEGQTHPRHVYTTPVIAAAARRFGGDDFVLGCTDAGRAKWVESLANDLGVSAAFVYKRRIDSERIEVAGVSAHVAGRPVVIYDDMIRTGGSLIGAAAAYLEAGAISVSAIATHAILPGDSLPRLKLSGLLSGLVCTDSHPRALELRGDFLRVDSIAPLLAEHLREVP